MYDGTLFDEQAGVFGGGVTCMMVPCLTACGGGGGGGTCMMVPCLTGMRGGGGVGTVAVVRFFRAQYYHTKCSHL